LSPGAETAIEFFDQRAPSYSECRARTDYAGPLPLNPQVQPGSHICIRTRDNRVGYARIDYTPNQDGEIDEVTISGVIFRPK
jgi:hypothetical protein